MNIYRPLIVKRFWILLGSVVLLLGLAAIPVNEAEAKPKVYCLFSWDNNTDLNVERWEDSTERKVRTKEYDRLVMMGEVPARVAADRGGRCQLNHPENALIDITVKKADHKLNEGGRIPHCADLNAMVECSGDAEFIARVHREPIQQGEEGRDPRGSDTGSAIEGFYYHVINKKSNKCATVKNASTGNGADIIQWTCHDQPNTLWGIVPAENSFGIYYLKAKNSRKCAVVRNASEQDGADIIQWTCHNQPNTLWEISEVDNSGYFHILGRGSRKCLHVHNGSTVNGGDVRQRTCANRDNFLWKIRLRDVSGLH